MKIIVVNKHNPNGYNLVVGEHLVYIGRGSILGNPYSWGLHTEAKYRVRNRDEAITKYADYMIAMVKTNPEYRAEMVRIGAMANAGTVYLQCFCAPKPCHGDTVKMFLEQVLSGGILVP